MQQTNCHPFRQGRWLFVHNGVIAGFQAMRRELMLAVDPSLFDDIAGSTDSETLFYLALTFGLQDDPLGAMERAVGFVEATGREHGVEHPIQMTVGMSNGERLWAIRYSSEHQSRTLFVSEHADALRKLHPDNPRLQQFTDEDRIVVSEPPGDLPGAWLEIPESTALIIQPGAGRATPLPATAGRRADRRITMSTPETRPHAGERHERRRPPRELSTRPEEAGSCSPGSC